MHKKLIKKIIKDGKEDDMLYLEELLNDLICDLKITNNDWYKQIEYEMYKKVYGRHLSEELAKEWVSCMENKDGSKGQHWSIEETNSLAGNYDKNDFYATLNMMFSDYFNPRFDTNTYIELAKDWLNDKDIEDKILKYYFFVVNG